MEETIIKKQINDTLNNYEISYLKKLDEDNIMKIVKFLKSENVTFIDDLMCDYLDLFLIDYDVFVKKFMSLKDVYGSNLVDIISHDLNILEQLY